jgi:flagellar motor switch protein FliG
MVGPDILDDLKRDVSLKAAITEVSDQAARQSEPLAPEQARRIAQEARARITAARVVQSGDDLQGDWEFVEGLSVPALQRIMGNLPARERSYALGKLPSGLRAAYMEQMTSQERRELFVGAGSEAALSRDEAIELASKLRDASSEVAHLGSEGSGQAEIILDMLRAVDVAEQEDTLRELRRRRPEVAAAVLSSTLLESAIPQVSNNALADAMYRTPIDELTRFMRGTREDVRAKMLEHAPSNVRGAILQELELDIPSNRGEYIDARTSFMATLATQLRREGEDLVALNARALTGAPSTPSTDA